MINFQELVRLLEHPKPNVRLMSIHIIRMVDEVQALDAVRAQLSTEQNRKIAEEFSAVADYLTSLKSNGYNTIAAICQQFNVYSDVLLSADEERFGIVYRMLHQFQEQSKDATIHNRRLYMSLNLLSHHLGEIRHLSVDEVRHSLKKRIPPTVPTDKDISRWVQTLKSDNPLDRDLALMQLSISNNSASLQYMAHTYMYDADQKIRDTAKRLGRKLYWNRIYYDMEQDGTLDAITQEFAVSLRLIEDVKPKQSKRTGVTDILTLAEDERKKRGWKER